jgi:hypothetical protein
MNGEGLLDGKQTPEIHLLAGLYGRVAIAALRYTTR